MFNHKNDLNIIKSVNKYINNNPHLLKIFNYHRTKYTIDELLTHIIFKNKNGISFRAIQNYTKIHWNTIYKFHLKLEKYNIFENIYKQNITIYLKEMDNKLGEEFVNYNPQVKKHKTTKVSIISDEFNIPISVNITSSNTHDSKIIQTQLIELKKDHPAIFNWRYSL